ncbi:hypothetical protein PR048_018095 [Dryococelus australis]|uniref:Uncharacterized protein n=1 Tax=Dryococelus australis TaxID=614101 RepID=A0ABQ9HBG3_9NEOP|nr:hypothetical protein PR048_018095 [Dryococelus australis]
MSVLIPKQHLDGEKKMCEEKKKATNSSMSIHDESDNVTFDSYRKHAVQELPELQDINKKSVISYVGQVEEIDKDVYKVRLMRKKESSWKFNFPDKEDVSFVERSEIRLKIHQPDIAVMTFGLNFSSVKGKLL